MAVAQVLEKGTGRLTWEEYAQRPATGERAEIVDGEVVPLAGATPAHQQVVVRLCWLLYNDAQVRESGAVLTAPVDVVVRREPLRVRQPDVLYIRYEKVGSVEAFRSLTRLEVAPDLVVEVLSPSDTLESLQAKLQDYHTLGVPEVWLVDLVPNHVFVLWREEDGWKWNEPAAGEKPIPSRQFPNLQWLPKALFEG